MENMRRELRFLKAYVVLSTAALAVLSLAAFRKAAQKPRFTEIDVERINIVEADGKLRLVLANSARSPAQTMHGKTFGSVGGRPGMIFYNDEGSENGGLGFLGRRENGKVNAVGSLTFDQFDQDQVVALQYIDENGRRTQGLTILERPEVALDELIERQQAFRKLPQGPERARAEQEWLAAQGGHAWGAPRLFAGRTPEGDAVVALSDAGGHVRLRMIVGADGRARVEFRDSTGKVVSTLDPPHTPGSGQ